MEIREDRFPDGGFAGWNIGNFAAGAGLPSPSNSFCSLPREYSGLRSCLRIKDLHKTGRREYSALALFAYQRYAQSRRFTYPPWGDILVL